MKKLLPIVGCLLLSVACQAQRYAVIDSKYISYILKHMEDNGLYEESDDIISGFPSKSGVSGALLVVIPGVMGIGIYSPPLNKYGNSVKGIKTMKLISKYIKEV
jgi:glutaminase